MVEKIVKIIQVIGNLSMAAAIVGFILLVFVLWFSHTAHRRVREGAELPEGSLPCPYCGSHNLKVQCLMKHYNVVCCNCGTDYPGYDTLEEAIQEWNWEEESV
jgi:hypothetical protein